MLYCLLVNSFHDDDNVILFVCFAKVFVLVFKSSSQVPSSINTCLYRHNDDVSSIIVVRLGVGPQTIILLLVICQIIITYGKVFSLKILILFIKYTYSGNE